MQRTDFKTYGNFIVHARYKMILAWGIAYQGTAITTQLLSCRSILTHVYVTIYVLHDVNTARVRPVKGSLRNQAEVITGRDQHNSASSHTACAGFKHLQLLLNYPVDDSMKTAESIMSPVAARC